MPWACLNLVDKISYPVGRCTSDAKQRSLNPEQLCHRVRVPIFIRKTKAGQKKLLTLPDSGSGASSSQKPKNHITADHPPHLHGKFFQLDPMHITTATEFPIQGRHDHTSLYIRMFPSISTNKTGYSLPCILEMVRLCLSLLKAFRVLLFRKNAVGPRCLSGCLSQRKITG